MAANITYLGEPGRTVLNWGVLEFPVGTPVLVDADTVETNGERIFYEHVLMKAAKNPHFTYEEAAPASRKKAKAKAEAKDQEPGQPADDDYPEEEENGDTEIPPDWRDMHHKKLIALARKLGGEGDALATRDGAIEYIDEYLALGGGTIVPKPTERA